MLALLSDFVEKSFCFFPSKTRVGDGFSIDVIMDLLAAIFDVALDHQSFHQLMDVVAVTTAVKDFLGNTDLFQILLVGVRMVGIYHTSRILEVFLSIQLA